MNGLTYFQYFQNVTFSPRTIDAYYQLLIFMYYQFSLFNSDSEIVKTIMSIILDLFPRSSGLNFNQF